MNIKQMIVDGENKALLAILPPNNYLKKHNMKHPTNDVLDRTPVWDAMQMFWMDTNPTIFLKSTAELCANSKYSLEELELIYWNEVRPAVSFNIKALPVPEWAGFDVEYLTALILRKHKYGSSLPITLFHRYANLWWKKLKAEIKSKRAQR